MHFSLRHCNQPSGQLLSRNKFESKDAVTLCVSKVLVQLISSLPKGQSKSLSHLQLWSICQTRKRLTYNCICKISCNSVGWYIPMHRNSEHLKSLLEQVWFLQPSSSLYKQIVNINQLFSYSKRTSCKHLQAIIIGQALNSRVKWAINFVLIVEIKVISDDYIKWA